jgi:ATP-dependent protease ClpP protease subunit
MSLPIASAWPQAWEQFYSQSGQPIEKIEKDTDRDYYMTAYEAKEYGLIDEVVEKKSDSATKPNEKKDD